jgi:hypothetical protein
VATAALVDTIWPEVSMVIMPSIEALKIALSLASRSHNWYLVPDRKSHFSKKIRLK